MQNDKPSHMVTVTSAVSASASASPQWSGSMPAALKLNLHFPVTHDQDPEIT